MIVGVCKFEIFMPFSHSLKEKRQVLRKLKEKVFAKFKVIVAEVDFLDKWQRASMGFAVVSNETKYIESSITKIQNFIISLGLGEVCNESQDILHYE